MEFKKKKVFIWVAVVGLVIAIIGSVISARVYHNFIKKLDMRDIRAALAAKNVKNPDERLRTFYEARYGSLTNPENRQKVFMSFFDTNHIQTLHAIVTHTPDKQRRTNILATAKWLSEYRKNMTPEEKAALRERLSTPESQAMLRQANAQFRSQDGDFKSATLPVITELLTTLGSVNK